MNPTDQPIIKEEPTPQIFLNTHQLRQKCYCKSGKILKNCHMTGYEKPKKEPFVRIKTPGRNDPCSCNSGKKYKRCCMLALQGWILENGQLLKRLPFKRAVVNTEESIEMLEDMSDTGATLVGTEPEIVSVPNILTTPTAPKSA